MQPIVVGFEPCRASAASALLKLELRYITNVSLKFGEMELQGCTVYFSPDADIRNLFGGDILKYFNWAVDNDNGEFCLTPRAAAPELAPGEAPIHIYTLA
ncbi:MAG: hypothetical protein LBI54_02960 [Lachnospiraceae bacterium]|jgi:hypothetical protein|nr:hypothetical protein [Lachnospiraceae bacterium]